MTKLYFTLQIFNDDTLFRQDTKNFNPNSGRRRDKRSTQLHRTEQQHDLATAESAHPPRHRTVARKEANPEFYAPHVRVPRQPQRWYDDPDPESFYSREEDVYGRRRKYNPHGERDRVIPEGQRFFPSFPEGRMFAPGPRRGSSRRRRPSFRSNRDPHEAFASHRFNDFGSVDNSLLGSGNFEVIRGGTFYDNDDPHLNHNPYDPYLDNSYVVFPQSGNNHNHNHVDDFFSNFRDFSEFATRRSDRNDYFDESSFASEHIPKISPFEEDLMTSDSNQNAANETQSLTRLNQELSSKLKPNQIKKANFINNRNKKLKKAPNNIQEVLEQVDSFPSLENAETGNSDPLIAIF